MELESAHLLAPDLSHPWGLGYTFQLQSWKCNLFWVIAEAEGTQGYLKAWGYLESSKNNAIATEGILRVIWFCWTMADWGNVL